MSDTTNGHSPVAEDLVIDITPAELSKKNGAIKCGVYDHLAQPKEEALVLLGSFLEREALRLGGEKRSSAEAWGIMAAFLISVATGLTFALSPFELLREDLGTRTTQMLYCAIPFLVLICGLLYVFGWSDRVGERHRKKLIDDLSPLPERYHSFIKAERERRRILKKEADARRTIRVGIDDDTI